MRNVKRVGAAAAVVALLALTAGPVLGADATVGRFVQELARVKNLSATDGRVAVESLRSIGIALPANTDLSRRLTERDVAEIARLAGLRVTTSNPDATFSDEKIARFFQTFSGELAESHTGVDNDHAPFDPFTKGQKKGSSKAKYNRTGSNPE